MNKKEAIELSDQESKIIKMALELILAWDKGLSVTEHTMATSLFHRLWPDNQNEEPEEETAPESIDIEVTLGTGGLLCSHWMLANTIGRCIEHHGTRYFARWYMINDEEYPYPCNELKTGTFASHVRFVREDLLRGIPK